MARPKKVATNTMQVRIFEDTGKMLTLYAQSMGKSVAQVLDEWLRPILLDVYGGTNVEKTLQQIRTLEQQLISKIRENKTKSEDED